MRLSREKRKGLIMCILRENSRQGGKPMTARAIAHAMNMRGFSYVNTLVAEMCDDGQIFVEVKPSNKAISNVRFEYYV